MCQHRPPGYCWPRVKLDGCPALTHLAGLYYRPWLRTLTWLLFYAFSVFSFVIGCELLHSRRQLFAGCLVLQAQALQAMPSCRMGLPW